MTVAARTTRPRSRTKRATALLGTLAALAAGLATATPASAQPDYPDTSPATPNAITRTGTTGLGLKWDAGADAARVATYEAAHPELRRTTTTRLLAETPTIPGSSLCHPTNIPGAQGFCWSTEDDASKSWTPQGVGASTADGRKTLVTSWYGPGETERLTFADVTDPANVRYRHVQLVGLSSDGSGYSPLTGHGHAVVWAGTRLYVASIGSGFDVFDINDIWQTGTDTYALPRTGSYAYTGAGSGCGANMRVPERPCISAASLDLSGPQPALVTAEMDNKHTGADFDLANAPIVRWPIDPTTGILKADATGRAQASEAFSSPIGGTQGVAMNQGRFALSAPCPEFEDGGEDHLPSCLYHGTLNEPVWLMTRTGIYNENLAYLPGTDELWMVNERPGARMAYRTTWPTPPAPAGLLNLTAGDFTGDHKQDIVGIEATTGKLWLYPGNGNATLGARVQIGTGWSGMNHLTAGDFDNDGKTDLLTLETATGTLQLYPGTGATNAMNTLGTRTQLGTGWGAMRSLTGIDLNKDGKTDLLAIDPSGALWAYPGTGTALGNRQQIGAGWNSLTELTSPGDLNTDGAPDLVAVDHDGNLWSYPGTGTLTGMNTLGTRTRMGTNWDTMRQLTGADFNGDAKGDLAAVQAPTTTTGNLYVYPGTGTTAFGPRTQVGTGW
ncbi:FG-GAP repeat domain-containing protein [Streptomyces sp. LN699]|uniref:FG-GAP repeat domain-containing protein n=1 Tax=Streptomyces sp. LN699 TaxID=3112981 RepID=UPI003710C11B